MLPSAGSPVINMGSNPESYPTDQRSLSRTVNTETDIGSVQLQT